MPLAPEWQLWAAVNGIPAFFGGVWFLIVKPARAVIATRLARSRPWIPGWLWDFDTEFAWTIAERRDALLLGVGYVFRGLLFAHIWVATTWEQIRWITLGNVAFAAVLLVVTMAWGDHFHWRRPTAIGWLFLYVEEPIWMLTLVPAASVGLGILGDGTGLETWLTALLIAEAGITLVLALYLLVLQPGAPDVVSPRILGGFTLGWTFWSAALAFVSQPSEAVTGLGLNLLWIIGGLVVLVRYR